MNSFEKNSVDLKPVRGYQGWQKSAARLFVAGSLMDAAHSNEQLRDEFPVVVKDYGHLLKAYRSLGAAAAQQVTGKLDTYVILFEGKATGLATVEPRQPIPVAKVPGTGAEISYWLGAPSIPIDYRIGKTVVEQLAARARGIDATPWMVTLPEDKIKAAVNQACGFVPLGLNSLYDLSDGVSAARQLWVPHDANAIDLTR